MPIYDNQMSYADMQKAVDKGALCGKCGSRLNLAWGGSFGYNGYILRCGTDITHDTMTRHDKKYEEQIREIKEVRGMDTKSLMTMTPTAMLKRVDMARFPQELTKLERELLAEVAITYGFDPLMGEVTIYEGRPYVSIDGRYRKAQETNQLDGVESRPATQQERLDWQIPDGDYFFRAEVYVKGCTKPFVAWGRIRGNETKPGSKRPGDTTSTFKPIQNNPQRMAEKRAEAQALRKAFHIPLPSYEDIGTEEEKPFIDSEGREVDRTTGEITAGITGALAVPKVEKPEEKPPAEVPPDALGQVLHPEKEQESPTPQKAEKEPLEHGKMPKPERDPATIKSLTELFKACNADFRMQPAQVIKDLGYKSKEDITDLPSECYKKIVASRCS